MSETSYPKNITVYLKKLHNISWMDLAIRSGTNLAVRILGAGLGFLFNVVLARMLGATGLGIYQLALTFVLVASVIGRVGMDAAMLKLGATSYANKDWERLTTLHKTGMGIVALTSGTIATITYLFAGWIATTVFSDSAITGPLKLMSLALIPFSLFNLYGELLKAGHKQTLSSFVQAGALPLINICIIYLFAKELSSPTIAAEIYLTSTILVSILGYSLWSRTVLNSQTLPTKPLTLKDLFEISMPMYGAAIADVIMTFSDVLILGMWVSTVDVGIYTAAARTALLTRFILLATSSVVAPKFAALHSTNDIENLKKLAVLSTIMTTLSTIPLLILLVVFPQHILSIFGAQFVSGAPVLIILTLGQFVNAATGPGGYLLNMCGLHRIEGRIAIAGAVMTVGFCFALIPWLGIIGAALANAIATAICNLLRVYYSQSRLGILMLPIPTQFLHNLKTRMTIK